MFEEILPDTLLFRFDDHRLSVQAHGLNAFRIRATKRNKFSDQAWALTESVPSCDCEIERTEASASITNGRIRCEISSAGKLQIYGVHGTKLLEEYTRNRKDKRDPHASALEIEARELRPIQGTDSYHLTCRFESLDPQEKIYGMGQYQQPYLNLKGLDLELAHRNSQASVPFYVSSRGYGFLWNNPAVGRAVFGKNVTTFEALSTEALDYWIVAGETPAEIVQAYASVTGHVPMAPEYALGFWQCKLRYESQDKLLSIAREYKKRNLPIDVIVIDFFHWTAMGDWKLDPQFWPDPQAMVDECTAMGIQVMISIWPTVEQKSANYSEMLEKGLLIRHDRGVRVCMQVGGDTTHLDATNPEARKFVWQQALRNYYKYGIKIFWLDEAEPEYSVYDFDLFRYSTGPNLQVGNTYPVHYAQAFYEGMQEQGQQNIINLLRCAWAGSQRYGALVWSGDIASSWSSFRNQLAAGLNMGLAGIPWWTTDIGGFHGLVPADDDCRELLIRWFQWGTYCPVMRLHGYREPTETPDDMAPGAPNEVWSFGDAAYSILVRYLHRREEMRDYIRDLMRDAHEKGSPLMRPLFYDFPKDGKCWEVETQYMFGPNYLVVPIMKLGQREADVYLPVNASWKQLGSNNIHTGGQTINVAAPLEEMPVFERQTTSI